MNREISRRGFLRTTGGLVATLAAPIGLIAQEPTLAPRNGDQGEKLVPIPASNFQISMCNSYIDFNSDGKVSFPVEFLGVKNKFSVTEDLTLIARSDVYEQVGKQLAIDLYDSNGEIVHHINQFLTDRHLVVIQPDLMPMLRGRGVGNYAAVARLNGTLVGKTEFEIDARGEVPKKVDYSEKGIELFICNWKKDFNNNGMYEKDDFVGRKDEFNPGESLMVVGYSRIPGQEGKTLDIRVYSSRGNVVKRISSYLGSDALSVSSGDIMPQVSQFGSGVYSAIATLGQEEHGKLVARKDFEIKEPVNGGPTFQYEVYPVISDTKKDCGCRK